MKEKILLLDVLDKEYLSDAVYNHETKILEIKTKNQSFSDQYLNHLFNYFESISHDEKKEKNDQAKYLFIGYFDYAKNKYDGSDESRKKIVTKSNNVNKYCSYVRVLDLNIEYKQDSKEIDRYKLKVKGIGRYKITHLEDNSEKTPENSYNVEFAVASKSSYENKLSKDSVKKLNVLDKTITNLVEKGLWSKILDHNLSLKESEGAQSKWMEESMFNTPRWDEDYDESGENIVEALLIYFALNSLYKMDIFNLDSVNDHIDYLSLLLYSYRNFGWTPKEKGIINSLKFFDENYTKTKSINTNSKAAVKYFETEAIFRANEIKEVAKEYNEENEKTKKVQENKKNLLTKKPKSEKDSKDPIAEALLENEINQKVKSNLEKQQKEFLLREKLKAIKESLSENDSEGDEEDDSFSKLIHDPKLKQIYPESVLKIISTEKERLKGMMSGTPDANVAATYISTLKKMPWRKIEVETLDIKRAKEVLDKNHYGLEKVKERIIEYLSLIINHKNLSKKSDQDKLIDIDKNYQIDMSLFKEDEKNAKLQTEFNNVPILTLVGPPGTGKTSLARAIAEALNKSYIKISLGGVHDESEIRGHRRTYVGSMPGKIIKAIQRAGVSNPLILLDEIDKMSSDYKGDPASAMLEVLDPEQNTKFQDNYLEHEYDLSKVMFIATANYYENIPAPLIDRVEIIELNSYTINEKIKIAREHLIDSTIQQAGLKKEQFNIDDKTLEFIIKHYTAEAGVRGLKRDLDKIARKIVTRIVEGEKIAKFTITKDIVTEMLGTPKFTDHQDTKEPQVGVVNGLAYTSIGGTTLQIEVSSFKSKNSGIKLTGSLKDVMKESANIALSYVRANAEKFDIKDFAFDEREIHIHVPEGAVPKDGPSAGVTFTTALVSALSNKPVPQDIAMTGEITLRGRVFEIGGLKEKSFAAYKKGIKTVFIPKDNEKNLADIPEEVKKVITFIPVETYEEIYNHIFKDQKPTTDKSDSTKKSIKQANKK
ncbi:endopeptidase La [Mycoplasmopsis fermentans]|uniref:endopeptidase La n=1 Tax=Mycoplasmopsis fermentans (strain M64) TaxID=943945 RepID=A0AB32XBU0_MYCFM|nr:endopeptidase La [Mycoplasmopsis fermentans]ADV34408.1 Putative Heat shock ATP-dependent protease [Mycoplasmopsis fermentans M64]